VGGLWTDSLQALDIGKLPFLADHRHGRSRPNPRRLVEAARLLLDDTRRSLEAVARETGFVNLRRMREAFVRH